MKGTVRWWKEEKGYGRITGDDDYVYFCHFSMVAESEADENGYRSLRQGDRVEFDPVPGGGAHGRNSAYNVRRI
jgi:CspA family cold shock protein